MTTIDYSQSFISALFFTASANSFGRCGKNVIPVIRSTCFTLLTYKSFLRLPSVFLQINPMPLGCLLFRHTITLKNASGTTTLFSPIVSCSCLNNKGPQTIYKSPHLSAHRLVEISIWFHVPLFKFAFCGQQFENKNVLYIASLSHLLSPAGHICPRVHPLPL